VNRVSLSAQRTSVQLQAGEGGGRSPPTDPDCQLQRAVGRPDSRTLRLRQWCAIDLGEQGCP